MTKTLWPRFTLLIILCVLNACAHYVATQRELDSQILNYSPTKQTGTYCSKQLTEQSNNIVGTSLPIVKSFKSFLQTIQKKQPLDLVDKFTLWALLQMNVRPDISSPSARLQLLANINNRPQYFNFYIKSSTHNKTYTSLPYLHGLSALLQYYKSRYSLLELAKFMDQFPNRFIPVNGHLANFLKKNHADLIKHKVFHQYYFKADQPLKKGETIPLLPFKKIVQNYLKQGPKNDNYQSDNFLFQYNKHLDKQIIVKCNYDLQLYERYIYIIDKMQKKANPFGIQDSSGDSIIALSSQKVPTASPLFDNSFLISGNPSTTHALCQIEDKKSSTQISLMSFNSRDPGQHIYHLIEKNFWSASSPEKIDSFLKQARYLILPHPKRLIVETMRSEEKELTKLLASQFPVYHSRTLGHMWAYVKNNKLKNSNIVVDDRHQNYMSCL
ncbi:MAG: hypothetical protein ISR65_17740 [Bacteriovoracaceae bacterium]|nr:hypothetical protein [Bacteriovoracaceae bacterium]